MKTPKQKAEELVAASLKTLENNDALSFTGNKLQQAKEVSKVYINHVLATLESEPLTHGFIFSKKIQEEYNSWQEVKNELNKM